MSKIPTAEHFLHKEGFDMLFDGDRITGKMIEFAKLHVEAALKQASEEVNLPYKERTKFILNAYPLTNIK